MSPQLQVKPQTLYEYFGLGSTDPPVADIAPPTKGLVDTQTPVQQPQEQTLYEYFGLGQEQPQAPPKLYVEGVLDTVSGGQAPKLPPQAFAPPPKGLPKFQFPGGTPGPGNLPDLTFEQRVEDFKRTGKIRPDISDSAIADIIRAGMAPDSKAELQRQYPDIKPEERGFWGKVAESFKRGDNTVGSDIAFYEAFYEGRGDPSQVLAIRKKAQAGDVLDPIEGSILSNLVYKGARIVPGMLRGLGQGLGFAAAAGATAAVAGAAIPLPEEAATIPGAAGIGLSIGSTAFWVKQGAGDIAATLFEAGVDHNIAKWTGIVGAVPYALIESAQVGQLAAPIRKGAKDVITESVKRTLTNATIRYGKTLTIETLEEVGQEAVLIASEDVGKYLDGQGVPINMEFFKDRVLRMWNTGKEAFQSFALLPFPGAAVSVTRDITASRQLKRELKFEFDTVGDAELAEQKLIDQALEVGVDVKVSRKPKGDKFEVTVVETTQPKEEEAQKPEEAPPAVRPEQIAPPVEEVVQGAVQEVEARQEAVTAPKEQIVAEPTITPKKIGDAQKVAGIDMIVADIRRIDDVDYELYNANRLKDKRGAFRIANVETGEAGGIKTFATFDEAEKEFNEAVRRATAEAPPVIEPTPEAKPGEKAVEATEAIRESLGAEAELVGEIPSKAEAAKIFQGLKEGGAFVTGAIKVEALPAAQKETQADIKAEARKEPDITIINPRAAELQLPKGKLIKTFDAEGEGKVTKQRDLGNGLAIKGKKIVHIASDKVVQTAPQNVPPAVIAKVLSDMPVDWKQDAETAIEAALGIKGLREKGLDNFVAEKVDEFQGKAGDVFTAEAKLDPNITKRQLKNFVSAVPEFTLNPTFTVEEGQVSEIVRESVIREGQRVVITKTVKTEEKEIRLVFQDNFKFSIRPEWFGLNSEQFKVGQTVRFDLESYGIKPASKKKLKEAEPFKKQQLPPKSPTQPTAKEEVTKKPGIKKEDDVHGFSGEKVPNPNEKKGGFIRIPSKEDVQELMGLPYAAWKWAGKKMPFVMQSTNRMASLAPKWGKVVGDSFHAVTDRESELVGVYLGNMLEIMEALNRKELKNYHLVMLGEAEADNENIQKAVDESRKLSEKLGETMEASGLEVAGEKGRAFKKRKDFYPQIFSQEVMDQIEAEEGKLYDELVEWIALQLELINYEYIHQTTKKDGAKEKFVLRETKKKWFLESRKKQAKNYLRDRRKYTMAGKELTDLYQRLTDFNVELAPKEKGWQFHRFFEYDSKFLDNDPRRVWTRHIHSASRKIAEVEIWGPYAENLQKWTLFGAKEAKAHHKKSGAHTAGEAEAKFIRLVSTVLGYESNIEGLQSQVDRSGKRILRSLRALAGSVQLFGVEAPVRNALWGQMTSGVRFGIVRSNANFMMTLFMRGRWKEAMKAGALEHSGVKHFFAEGVAPKLVNVMRAPMGFAEKMLRTSAAYSGADTWTRVIMTAHKKGKTPDWLIRDLTRKEVGFSKMEVKLMVDRGKVTDKQRHKLMRGAVKITQFSADAKDIPVSWAGEWGRFITQFWSMAYKHTQNTIGYSLEEVGHGRLKPLARFMIAGFFTGVAIEALYAVMRGQMPDDDDLDHMDRGLRIIGNSLGIMERPLRMAELVIGGETDRAASQLVVPAGVGTALDLAAAGVASVEYFVTDDPKKKEALTKRVLRTSSVGRTVQGQRERFQQGRGPFQDTFNIPSKPKEIETFYRRELINLLREGKSVEEMYNEFFLRKNKSQQILELSKWAQKRGVDIRTMQKRAISTAAIELADELYLSVKNKDKERSKEIQTKIRKLGRDNKWINKMLGNRAIIDAEGK